LKYSRIYNWEKCIDTINNKGTIVLDMRDMLLPTNIEDFKSFWLHFSKNIIRAKQLKIIELYKCPSHVVVDMIYSLPQLEVLNATSIK